uniref:DUF7662 domain-containing protein n=1 Tax=Caulobacter sp. (strain K31) TaxID=366602 RepID=B0T5I7_CAUSK
MAKYDPLKRYLARQKSPSVELSFTEMERLIGALLPKRAVALAWWSEDITGPGFIVSFAGSERVCFKRC